MQKLLLATTVATAIGVAAPAHAQSDVVRCGLVADDSGLAILIAELTPGGVMPATVTLWTDIGELAEHVPLERVTVEGNSDVAIAAPEHYPTPEYITTMQTANEIYADFDGDVFQCAFRIAVTSLQAGGPVLLQQSLVAGHGKGNCPACVLQLITDRFPARAGATTDGRPYAPPAAVWTNLEAFGDALYDLVTATLP